MPQRAHNHGCSRLAPPSCSALIFPRGPFHSCLSLHAPRGSKCDVTTATTTRQWRPHSHHKRVTCRPTSAPRIAIATSETRRERASCPPSGVHFRPSVGPLRRRRSLETLPSSSPTAKSHPTITVAKLGELEKMRHRRPSKLRVSTENDNPSMNLSLPAFLREIGHLH